MASFLEAPCFFEAEGFGAGALLRLLVDEPPGVVCSLMEPFFPLPDLRLEELEAPGVAALPSF